MEPNKNTNSIPGRGPGPSNPTQSPPQTPPQIPPQSSIPSAAGVIRDIQKEREQEKEKLRKLEKDREQKNYARDYHNIKMEQRFSFFELFVIFLCILLCVITFPICLFFLIKVIKEYERAVVLRLGKLKDKKLLGPGMIYYLPCLDSVYVLDLRTLSFDVAPQEILTKDAVTIQVDAVVYFHIYDPIKVILQVTHYMTATQLLAQTTLRHVFGTKTLGQVISEKEEISAVMKQILDDATKVWGIVVERVELKDVSLPNMLQRAMAAEAEALREAKAKIVAAEGEKESAYALKEAAEVLSQSPAALQLRYLQTLSTISTENNSTIVFPFPLEMLVALKKK